MQFDLESLINLIISTLLGVFTSFAVSRHYYKKNKPYEKILEEIRYGLPKTLMPIIKPQYYSVDSFRVTPDPGQPLDADKPYIKHATFSKQTYMLGEKVEVLILVVDKGENLQLPDGVKVLDHNRQPLVCKKIAFGLIEVKYRITDPAVSVDDNHELTFTITDLAGNTMTRALKFKISARTT